MNHKRAIVIVLDSLGVGALPDAAAFGDEGSCTLGHIWERMPNLHIPHLRSLGIGRLMGKAEDALLPARAMAKCPSAPAARIPRPAIGK